MIRINELKLPLDSDESELRLSAAKALRCDEKLIGNITILKKAVDSRHKNNICFVYNVAVNVDGNEKSILDGSFDRAGRGSFFGVGVCGDEKRDVRG